MSGVSSGGGGFGTGGGWKMRRERLPWRWGENFLFGADGKMEWTVIIDWATNLGVKSGKDSVSRNPNFQNLTNLGISQQAPTFLPEP